MGSRTYDVVGIAVYCVGGGVMDAIHTVVPNMVDTTRKLLSVVLRTLGIGALHACVLVTLMSASIGDTPEIIAIRCNDPRLAQ